MIVFLMGIPPGRIRLPDFYESMRNRTAIIVEDAATHDNAFSKRFACMLAGEVVIGFRNFAVTVDRAGNF
jgi:hypothetical protein